MLLIYTPPPPTEILESLKEEGWGHIFYPLGWTVLESILKWCCDLQRTPHNFTSFTKSLYLCNGSIAGRHAWFERIWEQVIF